MTAVLLSGCAVPVPVQVASWIADGFSLLTTDKSLTDHGLSFVADQDCALLRGFTEGQICRDEADGGPVAVADAGDAATAPQTPRAVATTRTAKADALPGYPENLGTVDQLASLQTAAGEPAATAAPVPALLPEKKGSSIDALMAAAVKSSPKKVAAAPVQESADGTPLPGLYLVIGSFRDYANARTHRARFGTLTPKVLAAKVSSDTVFRVVVGPFNVDDSKSFKSKVRAAGIQDTWSIRVEPKDWRLARTLETQAIRVAESGAAQHVEVAALPR